MKPEPVAAQEHPGSCPTCSLPSRRRPARRAQLLAAASATYNGLESLAALAAGAVAGSSALVAFGLDSIVEVSSSLIILWQFRHPAYQSRERRSLHLIGLSFFLLAAYVAQDSVRSLLSAETTDVSLVGTGLAVTSLVVMPALSRAQRQAGRALHSNAVVADSRQTLLCSYLSAVLLGGLAVNAVLGWWWADPIAALVISAVAVKEGLDAVRGGGCCSHLRSPGEDDAGCHLAEVRCPRS
jgi:divalent metal cation (Fe/Co/Zn/Cd) transporter